MTQPATRPGARPTAGQPAAGYPMPAGSGPARPAGRGPGPRTRAAQATPTGPRRTVLGLSAGQIVVAQLALATVLAAVAAGVGWLALAAPVALIGLVIAFGRMGRQWLFQLIAQGLRYFGRKRSLPAGGAATALLDLLRPGAATSAIEVDSTPVGVIEDAFGVTSILEVGDTNGLLAPAPRALPAAEALLPTAVADQPAVRLQLIVTGSAPSTGGGGAAANSYRQLTDGRILAQQRVLIAVHVARAGGFDNADLERSLASAVRRVRRRLDRVDLPCRPLSGDSVPQVLVDLAHHHPAYPLKESWSAIELGGLHQVSFRLTRWPDPRGELSRSLIPRLLTVCGGSTTTSLTVERITDRPEAIRAELLIRLAAPSTTLLTASVEGLRNLLGAAGARARRLDGTQLEGLAATLPLGGAAGGPTAALNGMVAGHDGLGLDGAGLPVNPGALRAMEVPVGGAGLMLGLNRHHEPVVLRLFRPEPTRAALVGGLRCAQLAVLRALAVEARVVVQSGRPYEWEPFLRGVSTRGTSMITLIPPGRVIDPPAASPVQPQLVVIDVGPVGATGIPVVESAWRATLLVRDELSQVDFDIVARADLALLQPLTEQEAYVASAALGLGESASWLTRIRADMIGVVVGRRTLRWALLSPTPIEEQLIGSPARHQG